MNNHTQPHLTYLHHVTEPAFTSLMKRVKRCDIKQEIQPAKSNKSKLRLTCKNNKNVSIHKLSKRHVGLIPKRMQIQMPIHRRKHLCYPLQIGTDCSGIEAPIMALQLLRVPHNHIFSTEIDERARESIRANYSPFIEYDDIFARDVKDVPNIDVYVCGFPCQSFSIINANGAQGFYQENNKGIIFFQCYKVICHKQPAIFMLENVKSLLTHDNGNTFKVIQSYLDSLSKLYIIQHKVLNAKDFDGNLQNRPRVYIVGIRRDYLSTQNCALLEEADASIFPAEQVFNVPIADILLAESDLPDSYKALPLTEHKKELLQQLQDKGIDLSEDYVVNLNISGAEKFPVYAMKDRCPCLLANCSPFYITSKERCLSAREALRIQGFPDSFKQVVSERQMLKQCGNSMSIAVLTALFKHLLMMHK
jgi:DNA (cytosine-5)-methyltransferase 1